jgi:hypothetical protein
MVFFRFIVDKLLPPLIAGLILLQCKLHLVNWDKKKEVIWQNEFLVHSF